MYSLLTHNGLSNIDLVNAKGQTAQRACTAKGSRQLATVQTFEYANSQQSLGRKTLAPPRSLWFWYLLMPAVFFCSGGLMAELLQSMFGWLVVYLCVH